jgi:hypothetical protein
MALRAFTRWAASRTKGQVLLSLLLLPLKGTQLGLWVGQAMQWGPTL